MELHPGARYALTRLTLDEMQVAQAIAAGELSSPQRYENIWLFALRITGTGGSYRSGLKEYVWRDPAIYLNDAFLQRCNGLPVIVDHPASRALLNGRELSDRIAGTIMLPHIRGDEVWGIARIYDETLAALLQQEQFSTSPAVKFGTADGGIKAELDDGSKLLIEGRPPLLDHLAICANGVWDKGGPPTGVSSITAEEPVMADARSGDPDIMTKLDASMTALDKMSARLDAIEAKEAEERKARDDEAARADQARRDAESEAEEEKRQAAELERLAREERKEGEKADSLHRRDAESCADHSKRVDAMARKHRNDRMARRDGETEDEHSGRCDKYFKADAAETGEEERALEKAKEAKAKEAKERDDKARADAAERESATLRERLAAMESTVASLTRETPVEERDALASTQARADSVAAMFGERVVAPLTGETSLAYRRRLLKKFQPHSPQFKDANFETADSPTLSLIENQVYADAQAAARNTSDAKPGILVPHVTTDAAGRQITRFHGDPMAWMQHFCRGGQRGKILRNPAKSA